MNSPGNDLTRTISPGAAAIILSLLSCRPVVTVGWWEIIIVGGLFLIVLGVPLLRLYRRWIEFRQEKHGDHQRSPND